MSTLRPHDIVPGDAMMQDSPASVRADKPSTPVADLSDRDKQARSFVRRRRVQAMRRARLVVLAAVVATGGWWSWQSGTVSRLITSMEGVLPQVGDLPGMTVRQVEVSGIYHLTSDDVIHAAAIAGGAKIADVDLVQVRAAVEDLGWVKTARVARLLPDTIRIEVVERTPFALWQYQGVLRLIDAEGHEMNQDRLGRFATLPLVVGQGAPAHASAILDILGQEEALAARTDSVVRVGDRRWDVRLDNGVMVRLPEKGAGAAWRRLADLERNQGILGRDITALDMRLPDRLIVKLTPEAVEERSKRLDGRT